MSTKTATKKKENATKKKNAKKDEQNVIKTH